MSAWKFHSLGGSRGWGLLCLAPQLVVIIIIIIAVLSTRLLRFWPTITVEFWLLLQFLVPIYVKDRRDKRQMSITWYWVASGSLLVVPSVSTMTYLVADGLLPRLIVNTSLYSRWNPAAMLEPVNGLWRSGRTIESTSFLDVNLKQQAKHSSACHSTGSTTRHNVHARMLTHTHSFIHKNLVADK